MFYLKAIQKNHPYGRLCVGNNRSNTYLIELGGLQPSYPPLDPPMHPEYPPAWAPCSIYRAWLRCTSRTRFC